MSFFFVALAVAPVASWAVSWMLLNVPALVGVPLRVMVLPLSAAESPAGKPEAVRLPSGPVPPETLTVPLKPGWLTVQAVVDSVPSVGAALMVRENVPPTVAPVES